MISVFCPWCETDVELDKLELPSAYLCESCNKVFVIVPDIEVGGIRVVRAKTQEELAQAS